MIARSGPGRKHSCQTKVAQVSLSSIRLPGRGKQVQDPSEHALSPSTLIRGQAISAPQVQGGAYSGEVMLKRVNTVPSATLQDTDQLLAQQLLRDHSPLGLAAVFAVTVSDGLRSPEAPMHTQAHNSAQSRLCFQGKEHVYH